MTTPTPVVGFMELLDLTSKDEQNARSVIERLCDQLETHEAQEAALLGGYEAAAEDRADPGVSFLMKLIAEDEERHHRLMRSMAQEVRQSLTWSHDASPLPSIRASGETRARLLDQTRAFLAFEKEGVRELEDLEKDTKQLHSGLLELLIETMRDDTKKHSRILEYIEKQLKDRKS